MVISSMTGCCDLFLNPCFALLGTSMVPPGPAAIEWLFPASSLSTFNISRKNEEGLDSEVAMHWQRRWEDRSFHDARSFIAWLRCNEKFDAFPNTQVPRETFN